jgi:hypothetical protein
VVLKPQIRLKSQAQADEKAQIRLKSQAQADEKAQHTW